MEEQVYVKKRPRNLVRVIIVLAIILIAVEAYLLFARGPGVDPAAYVPEEVAIAASIDLTASADRTAALDVIHSICKDAGIDNPEGELYKEIKNNLNIDVEKDVLPHLSGTGAAAVLPEMSGMTPSMVVVIGAKSGGDAKSLMKTLTAKLKENDIGYEKQKPYKGCEFIRIQGSRPAYGSPFGGGPQITNYVGSVKSSIVWASSEGGFRKVVDTANGQPSLLKSSEFARLRRTSASTFATIYFSGTGYYKLIGPYMNMAMGAAGGEMTTEMKEQLEGTTAVGVAEASGDGLKLTSYGTTKKAGPDMASEPLDGMAEHVPVDAKIAIVLEDWDKIWAEMEKQAFANPTLKGQIVQGLEQAKQMMGFDLQSDLLDRLTSLTGYYIPAKPGTPGGFPGAITLVATVDKPGVVQQAIGKLQAFIAMSSQKKTSKVSVAGHDVWVMQDQLPFCIAIAGDKVIVSWTGSVAKSMTTAIKAARGQGATLKDTDGYKLVRSRLPDSGIGLAYGDIAGIFDVFKDDVPETDRKKTEAVLQHVSWFGATSEARGTESSGTLAIPFKR